jgi:16S rRNA processing protein RimM
VPDGQQGARVCVARIGAAHGLRGEVRLNTFTADPLAVTRYGVLESEDGARSLEIDSCRPGKGVLVVRFKGVADRTAAERLRNIELYVPRERLPAPEPGEFYHADLIGLRAVAPDGGEIGTVVAVQNFGAGDLLEIRPAAGGMTLLLPFTDTAVPSVDLAGGSLVVVRPEVMPGPDDPPPPS